MDDWLDFLKGIFATIERLASGRTSLLFRGQCKKSFTLTPSVLRPDRKAKIEARYLSDPRDPEDALFFEFISKSQTNFFSDWHALYLMQHHALPTRLLDWTESLGVAFYFAVFGGEVDMDGKIWILNPHLANQESTENGISGYVNPEIGEVGKYSDLLKERFLKYKKPIAILPTRRSGRLIAQRGAFTLHGNDERPIESIFGSDIITGIDIPNSLFAPARKHLNIMGLDRYTLFPDNDNLAQSIFEV